MPSYLLKKKLYSVEPTGFHLSYAFLFFSESFKASGYCESILDKKVHELETGLTIHIH